MSSIENIKNILQQYNQSPKASLPENAKMSSQRFCLRWNNHQSNLLSVFDQLLHDESFVDVTLAVEGQLLRAHKMVLSACSPYFQALFVNHPDKHPIVILKDISYTDMKSLLDFMYRGEVSVDQDRLTAFLRVAESLRIKGLTEVNEEKCDIPSITSSLLQPSSSSNPPPNLHRIGQQNQPVKRPISHMMNPLLGNALMQPKRKRGRPRKLSGSSNGGMGSPSEDFDNRAPDLLVQGSPEMLEVKMGMDGFTQGGNTSDSSTGKNENSEREEADTKIKRDDDPVPGSSKQEQDGNSQARTQEDYTTDSDSHHQIDTISVRLITDISQEINNSTSVIQLSRPVPVIKCANSPPLLELQPPPTPVLDEAHGVHFLTPGETQTLNENNENQNSNNLTENENQPLKKTELLEYLIRGDGSVTCKMCGEILASRTHWYRHKYKLHSNTSAGSLSVSPIATNSTLAVAQHVQPSPLFKCELCSVFFKSKKGYMGHVAARHTTNSSISTFEELSINPESSSATIEEVPVVETILEKPSSKKKESKDPGPSTVSSGSAKNTDIWEKQREKEEKLVADIIDRVKRECEAQGAMVSRRGYSRRSTVMNTCN